METFALCLVIIGGINWGSVGIFGVDMVAWLFGGAGTWPARTIYILIALCAVYCISLLFHRHSEVDEYHHHAHEV